MWLCAGLRCDPSPRSYGKGLGQVQRLAVALAAAVIALASGASPLQATDRPVRIVALGDSLMAGYQLSASEAFPAQLQRALDGKGLKAEVVNAGVSGDTTAGGLARLDWSVPAGTDAVILELGANDGLRAIEPRVTRAALDQILGRLKARGIAVLLCGMLAPPNLGRDYAQAFDAIYPELAEKHGVLFYPFFLDGIFGDPKLNQSDGLHPTGAGVAAIVTRILPKVEALMARVQPKSAT